MKRDRFVAITSHSLSILVEYMNEWAEEGYEPLGNPIIDPKAKVERYLIIMQLPKTIKAVLD